MNRNIVMSDEVDQIINDQPRWRIWRELTLFMLMIMEVSWVVPWFRSLTPATYAVSLQSAFLIFLALILAAHMISRLFSFLRLKIVIRQTLLVLILLLSILIGFRYLLFPGETEILAIINRPIQSFSDWGKIIPDEFIVAIAIIFSWWRGISLAQAYVGPHLVMNNFILGIFMFFIFGFVNTLVTGETPGILLYVFVFTSLIAMSSSRMFIIHSLRGGGAGVFDRRWFGGISFAALVVVFIARISASLFGDGTGIASLLISGLFYGLSLVLFIILSPILSLLVLIFENIQMKTEIVEALSGSLENIRTMMQGTLNKLGELLFISRISEVISDWGSEIKAVFYWVIIIMAISGAVILIGLQIWKDRKRKIFAEEQQSILEAGEIWKLLRSSIEGRIKDLWGNLSGFNALAKRRRLYAAERIRQIYIKMMDMCQTLDAPRPESATPIEFMPKVIDIFPECDEEIKLITHAYNRIRYGQLPEKKSEIMTIEGAWRKIELEGHSLIETRKRIKKPPEIVSGGLKSK